MKHVSQQLLKPNLVFMIMGKQPETINWLQMRQHLARSEKTKGKATRPCHRVRPCAAPVLEETGALCLLLLLPGAGGPQVGT